jgi:hypothetical protein
MTDQNKFVIVSSSYKAEKKEKERNTQRKREHDFDITKL